MFQKMVVNDGALKVINVSTTEECKNRPCGLNTVNLLKVCIQRISLLLFCFSGRHLCFLIYLLHQSTTTVALIFY